MIRRLALPLVAAAACLAGAEATPPVITLVPQSAYLNLNQQFGPDGQPRHSNGTFNYAFSVRASRASGVVGMGEVEVSECVTDADESLIEGRNPVNEERGGRGWRSLRQAERAAQGRRAGEIGTLNLRFSPPTRPASAIRRLAGTVTLMRSDGRLRFAELRPVSTYLGHRLRIADVPGLVVVRRSGDQVEISVPNEAAPWLDDVLFLDAAGIELPVDSQGGDQEANRQTSRFRVRLPENGAVSLRLHRSLEAVRVPFVATDLPLPGMPREERGGTPLEVPVIDGPEAKPLREPAEVQILEAVEDGP